MVEVNIEDVVYRLSDSRSTARKEALDELRLILQHSKGTSRVDSLGDIGFHQIFEALFRCVQIERTSYINSSKSSISSIAANRLRDCATIFRLAVELGVRIVTSKTANAVIDHVVDTLPVAGEAYCQPLTDDYLKILRTMLERAAHVEHLRKKKWSVVVEFLIQGISHYALEDETPSSGTNSSILSQSSRNGRTTSLRFSQSSVSRPARHDGGRPTEDLFICLERLTAATNAPIMSEANLIVDSIIGFLNSSASGGILHQLAFSCVNNTLSRIIKENSKLAQKVVLEVLPTIRRLWSTKNLLLRDEMLITLLLSKDIIESLPKTNHSHDVYSSLSNLVEVLSAEYSRRNERDVLQLDEIVFDTDHTPKVMSLDNFRVRAEHTRGTFNWAAINVLAFTTITIDHFPKMAEEDGTNDAPSKRRKLASGIDEVFRHSLSGFSMVKVRALQTVPFLLYHWPDLADRLLHFIVQFTNQILDEDTAIASWTMIALSSLASVPAVLRPELKPQWLQIWHLASRNLSNPNVSRSAAHLLNTILKSPILQTTDIPKLIDNTLFSDGLNGPVGMSDAALSLWSTIVESRSAGGQSVTRQIVVRLVNWLSSHYTLTPLIDRATLKQLALHGKPSALLKLLLLCTNAATQFYSVDREIISSSIYITTFQQQRDAGLSKYLIQGVSPSTEQAGSTSDIITPQGNGRARDSSNDHAIIEMLLAKLHNFRDAWATLSRDRASSLSADMLQLMVSLVVVSTVLPNLLRTEQSQTGKELIQSARQVWSLLSGFIELPEDVDSINASVAAATITTIRGSEVISKDDPVLRGLSFMVSSILVRLHGNNQASQRREKDDMDMADIDDSFVSHSSQANSDQHFPSRDRQDLPFTTNHVSFNRATAVRLQMYVSDTEAARLAEDHQIPLGVDYLATLKPEDLIAARNPISTFLRSFPLSNTDACRLLKNVAQACVQEYEFERCEASLCLCLEVMTELAELWAVDEDDELQSAASDMYEWFINIPLGKGLASTRVLISLASLLQKVLNLNPTYNSAILPSSRTSLFEILRTGSNVVRFHVAERISNIFGRFVLTEHTAILEDVIESLPNDSADIDGIALRLYVLAELAARWSTLLRKSIYHMFETPAHIPRSVPHAQSCLSKISSALKLESPKDLFCLFAPQLLYTWLQTETLDSIPFSIYGFRTLQELISYVEDEVTGQIVMRADDSLAERLSEVMETPFDAMLETSFSKAEAYSVARDISMPPSKDNASQSTESQVRRKLGTERYLGLVSTSFPQIIANLFLSLSDEHEIERALARRPEFAFAATNLQSICQLGASKVNLPPGQQPSFRAKYLLDELAFLCQRIGKDLTEMWNSPLVVYVCRNLLDSVVPALGSLHACSVLRKVRILVAMADREALQGYALEMLLQALQPYLTKFYCAEDAIGLFWYLLDQGSGYVEQNLSFICGVALTTLLSLSAFLSAPQDSTTQESHYISTLSTTASFHKWFAEYLATFPTHTYTTDDAQTLKVIISYAQEARPPGRADKDSVEGKLLLELLETRTSNQRLLDVAAFKAAVQILCSSFVRPVKPEEDILGEDSPAIRYAEVLWTLLGKIDAAQEFWIWAGEALGRAYAASGVIGSTLTREHPQDLFQAPEMDDTSARASRSIIIDSLRRLLRSDNSTATSFAEKTLRQVITHVAGQKALNNYEEAVGLSLIKALNWHPSPCPDMNGLKNNSIVTDEHTALDPPLSAASWASKVAISLVSSAKDDPVLGALPTILSKLPDLAMGIMPSIVHAFLEVDLKDGQPRRQTVSQIFRDVLHSRTPASNSQQRLVLSTLLYLRCQPLRQETTITDRTNWLDVDLGLAAAAATSCTMYKTALLLLELQASQEMNQQSRSSRRSLAAKARESPDLIRQVYRSLDDPDFFYGVREEASLDSVMSKLNHEGDKFKSISFQSAACDSNIKASRLDDNSGLLGALVSANMNSVAHAVQTHWTWETAQHKDASLSTSLIALNLHQWDLPISSSLSEPSSLLFQIFRTADTSPNFGEVTKKIDGAIPGLVKSVLNGNCSGNALRHSMSALAALTETREVICSRTADELTECCLKLERREGWQETEDFDHISSILATREALFASIKKKNHLATAMRLSPVECHLFEVKCVRHSLKMARSHGALQPALNRAIYMWRLVNESAALSIAIGDIVSYDFAGVLWDQGDMMTAIQMLRQLKDNSAADKQAIPVSRPALLADMGGRIADARLERPDEIITHYLLPAIKELKGKADGREAGRVYHEFAFFCDQNLQSADGLDEFSRVEKIRQQKETEVKDLEKMVKNAQGKQREQLTTHHAKAKQWYKLDDAEYQRLKRVRENFLQQTLENYLLSLRACDDYGNDVLRFCAMWLDNSSNPTANNAVGKYLPEVASRKFVPLMNQLSSRLLDSKDDFQDSLFNLLLRVCTDHPFHGMYQIFASSKSKGGKDDLALSRHAAANRLSEELRKGPVSSIWVAVHNSNISFIRFALDHLPDDSKHKTGSKVPLAKIVSGQKLVQEMLNLTTKIPPPTLKIPIRADCDYRSVPVLKQFDPYFTVAGGISAPKIITMLASDGSRMKALLKGGNDDLRQDSIMEQVFEQVSNLLKDHRETRKRQLGIRSYKVLPLTMNAGIIEFVSNTIPLHEYSLPAHQKYYPRDWKPNKCRKEIADAQSKSLATRIQTFRTVCSNFHPVLRHFFFERFPNPDDWFTRRLAYTRSTAAISMLGHVLGLGDRHGHNILLDAHTGEVVHIDLGVAFEAGRVLPIPEVVPFRLTRDVVDGMGLLCGVEGVFRRCCNFTLEALRQDQYSIMTILDVLRYDPLYSWSISPLRLQKMQEDKVKDAVTAQDDGPAAAAEPGGLTALAHKKAVNNPSEAERALSVVKRKLGKSLSVEATVNELIQQAVDERNLAVLYCGWAAYA